jgi:hypothetical protein
MHHMTTPATPDRVRLTISVTPEVHAAFSRLAEASSISISRAMGEWLGDTLDAVEFTAQKVQEARAAPKLVMREMHAYALGLADETGALLKKVGAKGTAAGKRSAGAAPAFPPSSNTGGKSPGKTRRAA